MGSTQTFHFAEVSMKAFWKFSVLAMGFTVSAWAAAVSTSTVSVSTTAVSGLLSSNTSQLVATLTPKSAYVNLAASAGYGLSRVGVTFYNASFGDMGTNDMNSAYAADTLPFYVKAADDKGLGTVVEIKAINQHSNTTDDWKYFAVVYGTFEVNTGGADIYIEDENGNTGTEDTCTASSGDSFKLISRNFNVVYSSDGSNSMTLKVQVDGDSRCSGIIEKIQIFRKT